MSKLAARAAVSLIWIGAALATEPDGHVALRYAWIDHPGTTKLLRVTVAPAVPTEGTVLRVHSPLGTSARLVSIAGLPATPPAESRVDPQGGIAFGRLLPGAVVAVDFEVDVGPQTRDVLEFRVEAEANGRAFAEGVGVPIGRVGKTPVVRDGAAEYPASRPSERRF